MAEFEIDGVGFYISWRNQSTPDRFVLLKDDVARERYLEQLGRHRGGNVLELGIYQGGSAALAMLAADPAKLVAVDISEPVEALETFRTARGLEDRLRTHYRCDQADRAGLARILDEELGDEPLDLILDDASHLHDATLASFEVAFPRLRPGGEFIIEDWSMGPGLVAGLSAHLMGGDDGEGADLSSYFAEGARATSVVHAPATGALLRALAAGGAPAQRARAIVEEHSWPIEAPRTRTMAAMVVALTAVAASRPGEIERIEITPDLITVVRGPAELPRDGWTLEREPGEAAGLLGLTHAQAPTPR